MRNRNNQYPDTAFYGIGIMQPKREVNIGSLWRSAYIMGASFIFTVDKKYRRQNSDVVATPSRIPLYHYKNLEDLKNHLPHGTPLIGVELNDKATFVNKFSHPRRAIYLLGSEANGLSKKTLEACHELVKLSGHFSLNVAVAGSIIMHDRINKIPHVLPKQINKGTYL